MLRRVTKSIGLSAIVMLLCFTEVVSADWAYRFVVYELSIYIVTDEPVPADLIEERIGEVTFHTDREGTYWDNFSNHFEVGTGYYSIRGITDSSSIAVETPEGTYVMATYDGPYAANKDAQEPYQASVKNQTGERNQTSEPGGVSRATLILGGAAVAVAAALIAARYIRRRRQVE